MGSPVRIAVFLSVILGITAGLHYYLWARLVRDTQLPAPFDQLGTWGFVALAVMVPLGMVLTRAAPRSVATPLLWVVYVWLGLLFFLFVLLVATDAGRVVLELGRWLAVRTDDGAADPARRRFLARAVGTAVGLSGLGLGAVALFLGLRSVAVKRVRVALAGLPRSRAGYTIVQLTDIHVGPTIGKGFIEELVAKTNALAPDLVAITGDLVDGSVRELGPLVAPLAGLRARDGVFFVTGNHEYYSGVDEWLSFLHTLGIRVLRNERVAIGGAEGFDLAGVDDWSARGLAEGHGPDLERALAGRDPARLVVLLAHQPKAITEAAQRGVGLQLSGHTHGGQLYPFNYLVKLQQPYVAGLFEHGATKIYVSNGTGYWGPPMRLGAPAEITRIELQPA